MASLSNPYGRKASTPVTTRLTKRQSEQVKLAAAAHRCTVGEFLRRATIRLARYELGARFEDPQGAADDLRAALGLLPESSPEEIAAAVGELVNELLAIEDVPSDSASQDPLQGAADAPPANPQELARGRRPAPATKLSAAQVKALAKAKLPLSEAGWLQLRKQSVKRA